MSDAAFVPPLQHKYGFCWCSWNVFGSSL